MQKLVLGLVAGTVAGALIALALSPDHVSDPVIETPPAPPARNPHAHGRTERPAANPTDRASASRAKAHLMKKFVAALVSRPQNRRPNPDWSSPLEDPSNPIRCEHCHDPGQFNIDAMKESDPGSDAVEPFRRDPAFMIPLMKKWVERLNRLHGDRLKGVVTCTTCHEEDPSSAGDRQERAMRYAYFMTTFVRALHEKPTTNREPAANWKPLLKDPAARAVRCSTCHTDSAIARMDRMVDVRLPRPEEYATNKEFMVDLMEEWVEKLNKEGTGHLRKKVVCLDCHDRDPRR